MPASLAQSTFQSQGIENEKSLCRCLREKSGKLYLPLFEEWFQIEVEERKKKGFFLSSAILFIHKMKVRTLCSLSFQELFIS